MKYVVLISNKRDAYDRYWLIRNSLEEAKAVSQEYTKDNKYLVEIHELGQSY